VLAYVFLNKPVESFHTFAIQFQSEKIESQVVNYKAEICAQFAQVGFKYCSILFQWNHSELSHKWQLHLNFYARGEEEQ
jgi:hypothetical protein